MRRSEDVCGVVVESHGSKGVQGEWVIVSPRRSLDEEDRRFMHLSQRERIRIVGIGISM